MSGLVYQPNAFNADAVGLILAPLWERLPRDAPECIALQEATLAMLFPFIPPDSFYDENGRIVASPEALIADTQRGHAYVAYLKPWTDRILSTGNLLQREFLVSCGLASHTVGELAENDADGPAGADEAGSENDPTEAENPPAIAYPKPVQAIATLNRLAQKYESSSVTHAAIELSVLSLQYIVDSDQAESFMRFLEDGQKPCPPEKLARFGLV